jgi:uncharacterized membrane protein
MNYFIIGGDGKEYGPITEGNLRQWVAEGRINAQTQTRTDADPSWRALGTFPELSDIFNTPPTIAPPPSSDSYSSARSGSTDFLNRDYELDIGGCISSGWNLVTGKMGVFFVGALIFILIQFAASGLGSIPFVGPLFSLAYYVCLGALMGGLMWMFLRGVRGEPAEVGDIFEGFKRSFGQLFLAMLVQALLIGAVMIPFIVVFIIKIISMGQSLNNIHPGNNPEAFAEIWRVLGPIFWVTLPVAIVCAIPAIYLQVSWKFTFPLILDKGMDFWTAMKTSFKMVNKHWFQVFGFLLVAGLINFGGMLLCCIPWLFTFPVSVAATMFAYETIFGDR